MRLERGPLCGECGKQIVDTDDWEYIPYKEEPQRTVMVVCKKCYHGYWNQHKVV